MDTPFICPDCSSAHMEPAVASLGHRSLCLDCDLAHEAAAHGREAMATSASLLAA